MARSAGANNSLAGNNVAGNSVAGNGAVDNNVVGNSMPGSWRQQMMARSYRTCNGSAGPSGSPAQGEPILGSWSPAPLPGATADSSSWKSV